MDNQNNNNNQADNNGSESTRNANNNRNENMQNLKAETAKELGIDLSKGGNISSRDAGRVGGNMVRKMTQDYKANHANQ